MPNDHILVSLVTYQMMMGFTTTVLGGRRDTQRYDPYMYPITALARLQLS